MTTPGGTAGTVLVTGSAGSIGRTLRAGLPELGWTVRGFDRVPDGAGGAIGDLGSVDDLDAAVAGVDAIAHFAGQPTEAPWPVIGTANVDGTVNLFEAARRHGVPRVVLASSNHAVGFTPAARRTDPELPADVPPRPDTLYGVSKVFGEALGRYYADRYGVQVACLRIGTCAPEPTDRRALSTWLSPADCVRLVDACLRAPDLDYAIVWGVSANTRRTWSLEPAWSLGYRPQDDAERWADRFADGPPEPSDAFVGGRFTTAGYGIDEVLA